GPDRGSTADTDALPRQGDHGDDRAARRCRRAAARAPPLRLTGVVRMALPAPRHPRRLPEPPLGLPQLGVELLHVGPGAAVDPGPSAVDATGDGRRLPRIPRADPPGAAPRRRPAGGAG